jgi:elongation factor Ts
VDNALKKAGINPAHCDSEDHIASNTAKGWLTEEQAAQAREIIATVGAEAAANLDENKIQNIAKGRLGKFFKEQTLENQEFVMEGKISVKEYIKSVDPEAKVVAFCRFSLSD